MITRQTTVKNKLGLHARAASTVVGLAQEFASRIRIRTAEQEANGKSIMSLMMLQASCGTELVIEADGDDEQEAIEALMQLIESRFGEDD